MQESIPEENKKKMTRRGFLKWTTALGVAGAAAIGIGAGYGSNLLLRPSTEKTVTTTATTTVGQPVQTLSYVPPLSPQVQSKVDAQIGQLVVQHAGDAVSYVVNRNVYRAHSKNGVITAFETEDLVAPEVPREDAVFGLSGVLNGKMQSRGLSYMRTTGGFQYHPQRILYPMKRVNARGTEQGQFVRISWDEALSTIANQMTAVTNKYGKYSILANPLLSYMGGVAGWESPSGPSEQDAHRFCFGVENPSEYGSDDMRGAFKSKLIVIWSENPVQATTIGWGGPTGYLYRLAKESGIPVIVIDPRYSMSAQVLADQWIPIKPGTDCAFALAVANVLFKENLTNQDYISKFVDQDGLAKWKAYVLGQTAGSDGAIDRTPEWAAPITGVPAATIRAFAELYGKSSPVWITVGFSKASKKPNGSNIAKSIVALQVITGNVGILGGTTGGVAQGGFPGFKGLPHPSNPVVPRTSIGTTPGTFTLPTSPAGSGALYFNTFVLQTLILNRAKLDAGQITAKEYQNRIGNLPTNPVPNVHMAFLGREINQFTDSTASLQAIGMLDFTVAMTDHMMRPSARAADLILPVTTAVGEDPPSFNTEHNSVFYTPTCSMPQGEIRTSTWITLQLAKLLGYGSQYSSVLVNTTWDQWYPAYETLCQNAYNTWVTRDDVKAAMAAGGQTTPPSWADFKKSPVVKFAIPTADFPIAIDYQDQISKGTPFVTTPASHRGGAYQTNGTGKIELYNNWLATTDPTTTWYGAYIPPMPMWLPMSPNFWTTDEFAKYPLFMVTPHPSYRMHDSYDAAPLMGDVTNHLTDPLHSGDAHQDVIVISPTDAAARGIVDGDLVRVHNDAGETLLKALVTSIVMPGVVSLCEGRWLDLNVNGQDTRGCTNNLTYAPLIGELKGQNYKRSPAGSWIGHSPVEVEAVR